MGKQSKAKALAEDFFQKLKGFGDFSDISNSAHYVPAPQDWLVVVSDVKNSTKAIENGLYKDVNMVGAACIAAVVNTCGDIKIPYVFGGDGATFLIPPSCLEKVREQLLAVKRYAINMHDMVLRVGAIPVSTILEHNKKIGVAKYNFSTGQYIAMFNGGGLALADEMVKNNAKYLFAYDKDSKSEPDLEGLSCRWHPIPAKRGTMLTMLVMALGEAEVQSQTYLEINQFLHNLLEEDRNPVANGNLSYKWPGSETLRQAQMVWKRGNRFLNLSRHIGEIVLFNVMNKFNLAVKGLDVPAYKADMIVNSDYRKFDDMLRMVIDCSKEQAQTIEDFLAALRAERKIAFGTHYSNTALMTCFVQSLKSDGHTHFIDGHDGGYAMAARGLKQQLKESSAG